MNHASIEQCINQDIFLSMCIPRYIENALSAEEAHNGAVKKWFEDHKKDTGKDLIDRVDQPLSLVLPKFNDENPQISAPVFVISQVAALDKNNASTAVREPGHCEQLILKLMKKIENISVLNLLFEAKSLWNREQNVYLSSLQSKWKTM